MRIHLHAVLCVCLVVSCGGPTTPAVPNIKPTGAGDTKPPIAAEVPHTIRSPHGDRQDPYFWLRDDKRRDPNVLAYLAAENAYTDTQLAATKMLQATLYGEIVGRIKQDDATVPTMNNGYWYYSRYEKGSQHPIHARRRSAMTSPEEILIDVSQRAKRHSFYRLGNYAVSEDNQLVGYAEDTVGRNDYTLRVKDIASASHRPDTIVGVTSSFVWHNDGKSFFYVGKEAKTLRSYRVYRHVMGTEQKHDQLLYEEKDSSYYTYIYKSKSRKFVIVHLTSTNTNEVRVIDANAPTPRTSTPAPILARERDHKYNVDHLDGRFVIRTNWNARNYRLMQASDASFGDKSTWTELLAASEDQFVHSVAIYHNYFAVSVRSGGMRNVLVVPKRGKKFFIDAKQSVYVMNVVNTPDANATAIRYSYSSPTTPRTLYERDLTTGKRTVLKRQPVLGGFDESDYVATQILATTRDGIKLPISVAHHKNTAIDGTAPALLRGYGAYGATMDPRFDSRVLSLLDRGFVYAVAHVRGSQKYGRRWYEAGKLLNKKNTFNDFVDATRHLIAHKYAAKNKLFAAGGSAGGLLMGAIINQAPELYRGIVCHVPFVDVVSTMLDETIPLTTNEFDEWGNPKNKEYYDYMLSYSPYDQVKAQQYPSMLVTTGLWDSQVQYWEPAKWVAKLRKLKTDTNPLLLQVNMKAGHGGKSGRYRRYRETARDYAFMLHTLQQTDSRAR